MAALCGKRETAKQRRIRRRAETGVAVKEESPGRDPSPLLIEKTQCPRCIGDERMTYEERTFLYCRSAVMNDYFDRSHLTEIKESERMSCDHPKCRAEGVKLEHLDHFRSHVARVHNVQLRSSEQVDLRWAGKGGRSIAPL